MKKKILMAMMLCVCVIGLTGCNKQEEKPRTLEIAFKEEQKEKFESFKDGTIKGSGGIVTEVDVEENEILIISEQEKYQAIYDDETMRNEFNKPELFKSLISSLDGLIESLDATIEDYDGNTVITYIYVTPKGDVLLTFSFDKDGMIE